jgi:hypothetical protein
MTITLKNVPPILHRTLKKQAKLHKRSLNQEAITCLETTLGLAKTDRQALHERIVKRREELLARGFRVPPGMEPETLIREDRDSR